MDTFLVYLKKQLVDKKLTNCLPHCRAVDHRQTERDVKCLVYQLDRGQCQDKYECILVETDPVCQ